jgi:hypothetical protein
LGCKASEGSTRQLNSLFVHAYGLDEFYDRISFALIGVNDQKVFILYDLACIYLEN